MQSFSRDALLMNASVDRLNRRGRGAGVDFVLRMRERGAHAADPTRFGIAPGEAAESAAGRRGDAVGRVRSIEAAR